MTKTTNDADRHEGYVEDYPTDGSMDYGTYPLHPDFLEIYQSSLEASAMPDNDWRRPRFFQLFQVFGLTKGLAGATLEAGCFRGLASHMLCSRMRQDDPRFAGQGHFMVDSFEGLSEPVEEDEEFAHRRFSEGAFTRTSLEHVKNTMTDFPETTMIKGWIPDAFNELPDQAYRFVHIDVDIYQPTLDSLSYFYPRLVTGGIIVVDDYGPWPRGQWPGCGKALRQFCDANALPFAALDTGNAMIIKR